MRGITLVLATALLLGSLGILSTASAHACLHGAADPPSSCECGDILFDFDVGPKVGPVTFTNSVCVPS